MISVRKSEERGHANHGWLDSYHTFSFADYHDPRFMGFRDLRVINEDRVRPGEGFPTHPHRDMEIVTYVLEGALEHRDSMGNGGVITPGMVQRMSAGTGITHSEYNASRAEPVHFLQIWIIPRQRGLPHSYQQKEFAPKDRQDQLRLVASGHGRDGALALNQDVDLYAATLSPQTSVTHRLASGRYAWVQVARGAARVNGQLLSTGDGAAVQAEEQLTVSAAGPTPAEVLLFDLP